MAFKPDLQAISDRRSRETPDVETSSEGYARRFGGEVGRFFLEVQNQAVLDLLAPWPGARVLDVGGGHAQLAPDLVKHGFGVTVVGSEEVCRQRLDQTLTPGSFEFRACDLLELPFPDRSFDVVISLRLVAHVEQWQQLLSELCRVAKHAVILDYSDSRSFNFLYGPLFKWKKSVEGNTRTFAIFRPGEPAREMERYGFGRPVERREFFLPMVVHRALKRARFSRLSERASSALGLTRSLGSPIVLRVEREEGEKR